MEWRRVGNGSGGHTRYLEVWPTWTLKNKKQLTDKTAGVRERGMRGAEGTIRVRKQHTGTQGMEE
jgi:hypothetical protein